jgi:hypothetical protein
MARDVFISYRQEDGEAANRLCAALERQNISCFIAPRDIAPGQSWATGIVEGIQRCHTFVVILSSHSQNSRQIARELELADSARMTIIAVRTEDVQPPPEMLFFLGNVQWVDAFNDRFEPALGRLIDAITSTDRYPSVTTKLRGTPVMPSSAPSPSSPSSGWLARGLGALLSAFAIVPAGVWRLLKRLKLATPSAFLPAHIKSDEVLFTVTAPANVRPGTNAELIVWAHMQKDRKLVLREAMASLGIATLQKLLARSRGPFSIECGTVVSLLLQIEGVSIVNPHNQITWTGAVGNVNFVFSVPQEATEGTRKATCFIRMNGLEVARIDFLLRIGRHGNQRDRVPVDLKRYRTAFASYATEDREAVLAHVRGMQKIAPHLDVFVDVMKLRSGDLWAEKLNEVIPKVDVFYLFWCGHALRSEWVEKEWRCAYTTRGLAFIDPVPLESPELAPPPRELSDKHFNDPILAFIKHTP